MRAPLDDGAVGVSPPPTATRPAATNFFLFGTWFPHKEAYQRETSGPSKCAVNRLGFSGHIIPGGARVCFEGCADFYFALACVLVLSSDEGFDD